MAVKADKVDSAADLVVVSEEVSVVPVEPVALEVKELQVDTEDLAVDSVLASVVPSAVVVLLAVAEKNIKASL